MTCQPAPSSYLAELHAAAVDRRARLAANAVEDEGFIPPREYARRKYRTLKPVVWNPPLTKADAIILQAAKEYGVSVFAIKSKSRLAHIVAARQTVMGRLSELGRNNCVVGRLLKLDHSTVYHGVAKYISGLVKPPEYFRAKGPVRLNDKKKKPKLWTHNDRLLAHEMRHDRRMSYSQIGDNFGVSESAVKHAIKRLKNEMAVR